MSLPLPWVDRIFDKLTLGYGQAFLARWRDIDLGAVKSDWCHELSGFGRSPEAIAFALANLPERPPSVIEFKNICRQAPPAVVPQLDAPKADPARVAAELAKLRSMASSPMPLPGGGRHEWAHVIVQRVSDGDKTVSPTVHSMARAALGRHGDGAEA